jgi:glycosyltransferase involved in cell wall biosynthesis
LLRIILPNSNTPLVSIIVPVFNRAEKIKRLINTIQQQTYDNWELILIDDASTDNTKCILAKFASQDKRFKVVDNKHKKGPSGARNTGLDYATGELIAYQDSDDEWFPHHLESMVHYLVTYPSKIDVMSANPLRKNENSGEVYHYDELDLSNFPHEEIEAGYLINKNVLFDKQLQGRVITTQCIVGKADILKRVRWNEELRAAVDIMHNLELCMLDIGVCHLQDYHAIYWAHEDNLTNVSGKHSPQRMEMVHSAFALYWQLVLDNMELTSSQKKYVQSNLAKCYAWHLAYNTFESQKKYKTAIKYYLKAIQLTPLNIKIWKSLCKSVIKNMKSEK